MLQTLLKNTWLVFYHGIDIIVVHYDVIIAVAMDHHI